jgi:transcriptional regulator with XRE-family HTH domain
MEVGKRIREVREDYGMSRNELARRVGVAGNHLYMIETDTRTPSLGLLEKVARELRTEPAELLREPAPLAEVPPETGSSKTTQLIDRPEVQEWLRGAGHMNREEFLSWAEELESLEEVEGAIAELKLLRDKLLEDLRRDSVQVALFGAPRAEGLTGSAWTREVFRPRKLATRLGNNLRSEYLAREVALANYSRVLFVEGKEEDYLVYGPISEHDQERHQQMLAARHALIEESYAKELATV